MFFNNKKIEFNDVDNNFIIYSLYDGNLKKFYSLVLSKDLEHFTSSLCYAFDISKDNELLKVNKDNLAIYQIGFFNCSIGRVESKVKFLGSFSDLIKDYESKKFKGGKDGDES